MIRPLNYNEQSTKFFLKLESDNRHQTEFGVEIELVKQFIQYYYYEREYSRDSHNRVVIVVKYGNDIIRLQKIENEFEVWYNSK